MRTKSFPDLLTALLASAWLAAASMTAHGQAPVISSFGQNGQLVCTNLQPGSAASVEWSSSPAGPWTNNWAGLEAVMVDSEGAIRVSVPMFYRVRGFGHGTNSSSAPTNMALIPAGPFTMGDTFSEGLPMSELPLHTDYVSAFYLDRTEVTKTLWDEVKGWNGGNGYAYANPGLGKAPNHPVQTVNWYDVVKWCNARSQKEGRTPAYYTDAALTQVYKTGHVAPYVKWNAGYRLPTEAEWEKAARGGANGHRFPWSDVETITHSQANYNADWSHDYDLSPTRGSHPTFSGLVQPYTSPVGYFAANAYGLYDMAGNVWEWCWDWFGGYPIGSQTDPRGAASGADRVVRGGNWSDDAYHCRAARRRTNIPTFSDSGTGFRSVLPPDQP